MLKIADNSRDHYVCTLCTSCIAFQIKSIVIIQKHSPHNLKLIRRPARVSNPPQCSSQENNSHYCIIRQQTIYLVPSESECKIYQITVTFVKKKRKKKVNYDHSNNCSYANKSSFWAQYFICFLCCESFKVLRPQNTNRLP